MPNLIAIILTRILKECIQVSHAKDFFSKGVHIKDQNLLSPYLLQALIGGLNERRSRKFSRVRLDLTFDTQDISHLSWIINVFLMP